MPRAKIPTWQGRRSPRTKRVILAEPAGLEVHTCTSGNLLMDPRPVTGTRVTPEPDGTAKKPHPKNGSKKLRTTLIKAYVVLIWVGGVWVG